ncbi:MAG: response regulator [Ignavibacteriaceae bacterium]|jgi:signal transduction histidine kinase|nr:response regulator [Ignavibacteriaceae bacterium]
MQHYESKMTILIVDDTPQNIEILAEYLEGYKIKAAPNGIKALSILESGVIPDMILLDIMMPEMDGYEVCRRIKENPLTHEIPIIFITAMSEVGDKVKGFQVGGVDYITKPFQPEEVLSRIEAHIVSGLYRRELVNMNNLLEQKVRERTHELQLSKDKAEESSRLKSHFLSLMSHELHTPMIGILGYADALMEELEDPELKELVVNMADAAFRLKETLDSILILSKLESNAVVVRPTLFDLPERLRMLMKNHAISASLKGMDISMVNKLESPTVYLDSALMDIIFNNLVSNAIKYSNGGRVVIELYPEKVTDSSFICLKVTDTGIGIPKEKQDVIFEEFRQVEEGVTRNFEGVGLGLSLVKKYVHEMFGVIELQSEEGKGSSFTVKFEAVSSTVSHPASEQLAKTEVSAASDHIKEKSKLLIIDDDQFIVKQIKAFLSEIFDIEGVNDGESSIRHAQQKSYAVVFMDVDLRGGVSGIDIVKKLKSMKKYERVPVVALTESTLKIDMDDLYAAGFTNHITKPLSKKKLLELLNSII